MKKALVMALMAGMIGNAYAACPSNLNGNWSGTVVRTTNAVFGDSISGAVPAVTSNGTLTATVSGGSFVLTYLAESENNSGGPGGVEQSTTPETFSISYNKATCRGVVNASHPLYFTVSNSGKVLKGVSNAYQKGTGDFPISSNQTSIWSLERQ